MRPAKDKIYLICGGKYAGMKIKYTGRNAGVAFGNPNPYAGILMNDFHKYGLNYGISHNNVKSVAFGEPQDHPIILDPGYRISEFLK